MSERERLIKLLCESPCVIKTLDTIPHLRKICTE